MKNIVIFVSGNGTNCENIINHFSGSSKARVCLVISNRADAKALEKARRHNVETAVISKSQLNDSSYLLPVLKAHDTDLIVLAGFLLMIPGYLIDAYKHRMINLHPALLPKFGGKGMYGHHVHEAVKAAGEKETGMTVHWVSRECDGGEIIAQYKTPVSAGDTVDDIAEKEHELELKYFPKVIDDLL